MPRIPYSEPEIIALAQQMVGGLTVNTNLSGSPIDKAALNNALNAFIAKRDAALAHDAQGRVLHGEKDDLQDDLTDKMQRVIDYAEAFTDKNPADMASIGITVGTTRVSAAPGQPRVLEIVGETDASLSLDWKSPADGGRTSSYRVERRERPAGAWETCFATDKTEALLTNQPKGKEMEYRVVAFNANGDSAPSNSVAAVL